MAEQPSEHSDAGHSEEGHAEHDHGSVPKFLMVFLALCVLTAISFAVGSNETIMATPAVGWTIMMAVSCCKALLVMLFFMHLLWEANWKYVLTIPASIMSIFLLLMLFPDILGRTERYSEERWLHAAKPQVEHAAADGDHGDSAEHDAEPAAEQAPH